MDPYDRYELMINERVVKTPVALSSMAGIVDADYCIERKEHVGVAFIGGYSIDEPTINASSVLRDEGRKEFYFSDPVAELKVQIEKLKDSGIIPGVNLRGSTPESFEHIASAVGNNVIYEIDAHCRQEAMINACSGEYLLNHTDQLSDTIRVLKDLGATVSVKIRAGVNPDDSELARLIWKAGADIIHVDLMDSGTAKLKQIRNSCPLIIIANNSINNFSVAKDMFQHGADLISLARHADNETLKSLDDSIAGYADETGWYNAPKQLCRGGDIRSLTFCCMPVKQCALIPALKRIGMSPKEYHDLKLSLVKNTPLEEGDTTCFGSLAWCCKSSTPCMFRDISLKKAGINLFDYMGYKHRLSDKIMKEIFGEGGPDEEGKSDGESC